jgi:hypothetical protein
MKAELEEQFMDKYKEQKKSNEKQFEVQNDCIK